MKTLRLITIRSIAAALAVWPSFAASTWGSESSAAPAADPFLSFNLPAEWEARFWADPGVKALGALDLKEVVALVPAQAGLRYCRCPACYASEADDSLTWSLTKPDVLACKRCGAWFPNDQVPAKVDGKIPEDVVEVLSQTVHHYPYHRVDAERQAYPGERLYLSAKRDDEIREFLSKAALYAAARYRDQPQASKDASLARLAAVLVLRFAQVYPSYAVHYDQPGEPKHFQRADLPPPYQRDYRTAKWDWSGSLGVPLNLAIAYAIVRDTPAVAEAGAALNDPHPALTIERDLLRASATFVRNQPEEYSEASLLAYRGLLAVGRAVGDGELVHEAVTRLGDFAQNGFYHDGVWRDGDSNTQRRIVAQLDGWIARLLAGYRDPPGFTPLLGRRFESLPVNHVVPMLGLARFAEGATSSGAADVLLATWPAPVARSARNGPVLLGGAGMARLALGTGHDAFDLELRGLGEPAKHHSNRLALRLAVGGRPVIGDLDDLPGVSDGWDRATASHNTVVIDGLNQRETPELARTLAPGADILFFAADPDFQVVSFEDRHAYPNSASRYRQTLIAAAGARSKYIVAVFEVDGGLQHDQFFHGAPGFSSRWQVAAPLMPRADSLLPPGITFLPQARAEDGRWFVQAYGEFGQLAQGRIERPTQAILSNPSGPGLKIHLLGDLPATVFTGISTDPLASASASGREETGRGALIIRHRSETGSTLRSRFVTVFEPVNGTSPPLRRVGRATSPPDTIALVVATDEGDENVLVNLEPGHEQAFTLVDGRRLTTDALAVRTSRGGIATAGGNIAVVGEQRTKLSRPSGTIVAAGRGISGQARGWFDVTPAAPDDPGLSGRTLRIRHGTGAIRGWTIDRVEALPMGRSRIYVREEPGFRIDPQTGRSQAYQYPRESAPGPHSFVIDRISR
jgi:hypothetical protein